MPLAPFPDFVRYCIACAYPEIDAGRDGIPFVGNATAEASISRGSLPDDLAAQWNEMSWEQRAEIVLRNRSGPPAPSAGPERGRPLVVVENGPLCIPAALLCAWLGLRLNVTATSLAKYADELHDHASPVVLVGLPGDFPDSLLFGEQIRLADALRRRMPWHRLPQFSLLCGRDLNAIAWIVAKSIMRACYNGARKPKRLVSFAPGVDSGMQTLILDSGRRTAEQSGCSPDEFVATATSHSELLAIATHGFEACANGGGGVVLCGLNSRISGIPDGLPGVLACARGFDCPRGPRPVPLEGFAAAVLMVGSCNGLRLADSVLRSDFNLGLSFLDGPGLAYISTLFSAAGNEACTHVFSAALASGKTVMQACLLVNAFLLSAGLDHPAYLANGSPELTLADRSTDSETSWSRSGDTITVMGEANHLELSLSDPDLLELANRGELCLTAESPETAEKIYWFTYPVEANQAKLLLFRFPRSLSGAVLRFESRRCLERGARQALAAVKHWLVLIDLAGLASLAANTKEAAEAVERDAHAQLTASLVGSSYETAACTAVAHQTQRLFDLAGLLRDCTVASLSEHLLQTFWLTNTYSSVYRTERVSNSECPNCAARSVHKEMRDPLGGSMRVCVVCPRCGIVSDTAADGQIESIRVRAPEIVGRDAEWEVQVDVTARQPTRGSVLVCARLSANGWSAELSDPPMAELRLDTPRATARFRYFTPRNVPPHRYFVKVLAASVTDVAFASRAIFVV